MAERLVASEFHVSSDAVGAYAEDPDFAPLGSRVLAYAVDSIVLFGFSMVFATAAFLVIFIGSDTGRNNVTDGQEWGLVLTLMATLPAWYIANVVLMSWRGQSVGQYVIGLRVALEDGSRVTWQRSALYWLALHPLLFHPILAIPWLLFAFIGVALAESGILFTLAIAIALLCFAAPLVNLAFCATDPKRRALHDRLTGLRVRRV